MLNNTFDSIPRSHGAHGGSGIENKKEFVEKDIDKFFRDNSPKEVNQIIDEITFDSDRVFVLTSNDNEENFLKKDNKKLKYLLSLTNVIFVNKPYSGYTQEKLLEKLEEKRSKNLNPELIKGKGDYYIGRAREVLHDGLSDGRLSYNDLINPANNDGFERFERQGADSFEKARVLFPSLKDESDEKIYNFLVELKNQAPEVMKGEEIQGVYCDMEGTLFDGKVLKQTTLDKLKQYEKEGKVVMLWTNGNIQELQKLLDKNNITYPLKSKGEFRGATAEIVMDNDDQNTFFVTNKINARKFVKVD
jgi:hypothetical protein